MEGAVEVGSGTENTNPDTVEMIDTQFVPSQITVPPNTKIVWINRDNFSHTVTSGNPSGDGGGGY